MNFIFHQVGTNCSPMKAQSFKNVFAIILPILLIGCSSARDIVGLGKQSPDEFEVVTRAPLSLPPDYGLRVPIPNISRTQEKSVRDSADDLISSRGSSSRQKLSRRNRLGATSPAEDAILGRAQARSSDNSIRAKLSSDNKTISGTDKKLIDKIIFWQGAEKPGAILDPEKESKRINDLKSDGKTIANGDVPVIERADWGLLDGLF